MLVRLTDMCRSERHLLAGCYKSAIESIYTFADFLGKWMFEIKLQEKVS